jgi:RNA polymerase sigma factor (sigma-70 family)
MLRQYSPLVRRLAHQMMAKLPANVEVDDLIQVGMIGLADALSRFDPAQGVQFETFATQRIRGAMLDELRGNDWLSAAPASSSAASRRPCTSSSSVSDVRRTKRDRRRWA